MGALAKALRKPQTVKILGVDVSIKMLSIDELFESVVESADGLDLDGKTPQQFAQEAIETGRMPLRSFGIILGKACKDLDHDDIMALTAQKDYRDALKVIAIAMGEDPDSMSIVKGEGVEPDEKK